MTSTLQLFYVLHGVLGGFLFSDIRDVVPGARGAGERYTHIRRWQPICESNFDEARRDF